MEQLAEFFVSKTGTLPRMLSNKLLGFANVAVNTPRQTTELLLTSRIQVSITVRLKFCEKHSRDPPNTHNCALAPASAGTWKFRVTRGKR
jgi:hypothetical protein